MKENKRLNEKQIVELKSICIQPNISNTRKIQNDTIGIIFLPESQYKYSKLLDYDFETALLESENGESFLIIRIYSWDPNLRKSSEGKNIDYCVPMSCEGMSVIEKIKKNIPFGGRWSDEHEECILLIDAEWKQWFQSFGAIGFSNPDCLSAALMNFDDRSIETINLFRK